MDAEVEKTTLGQLIQRYLVVTGSMSESSRTTDQSIIKKFLAWWPPGKDYQVRQIRPSMLDEWLAHEEPRLRNVTYNRYAGFLKQLFDIALKDRMVPESPAKSLRLGWKKPQTPKRIIPTPEQFAAIVENIRSQPFTGHAQDTADFVAFLGLAGLGQAEASGGREQIAREHEQGSAHRELLDEAAMTIECLIKVRDLRRATPRPV